MSAAVHRRRVRSPYIASGPARLAHAPGLAPGHDGVDLTCEADDRSTRSALRAGGARHTRRMASRVVLFSTASCTYCEHAKNLLSKRGVEFEEIDLSDDPELQAQLTEVTGLESYPQIVVDGEPLGGLNELRAAEKSGVMASWAGAA